MPDHQGEGRFSLFGPNRRRGFHVALGDSSVEFLSPEVSEASLRMGIIRNDGERFDPGR